MAKQSAGVLLFRDRGGVVEVLLVHPGGPLWTKKDDGAWSVPKGEFSEDEDPLAAAQREFEEELGARPSGEFIPLGSIKQTGGKRVHAWALRGEFDPTLLASNNVKLEWPPKSGREMEFPEVDRAEWFDLMTARAKILKAQVELIDRLEAIASGPRWN